MVGLARESSIQISNYGEIRDLNKIMRGAEYAGLTTMLGALTIGVIDRAHNSIYGEGLRWFYKFIVKLMWETFVLSIESAGPIGSLPLAKRRLAFFFFFFDKLPLIF